MLRTSVFLYISAAKPSKKRVRISAPVGSDHTYEYPIGHSGTPHSRGTIISTKICKYCEVTTTIIYTVCFLNIFHDKIIVAAKTG